MICTRVKRTLILGNICIKEAYHLGRKKLKPCNTYLKQVKTNS